MVKYGGRTGVRRFLAGSIAIVAGVLGIVTIAVFQAPFLAKGPGFVDPIPFMLVEGAFLLLPQAIVVLLLVIRRGLKPMGAVVAGIYGVIGIYISVNWSTGGENLFGAPHDLDGLRLLSPVIVIGIIDALAAIVSWLEFTNSGSGTKRLTSS